MLAYLFVRDRLQKVKPIFLFVRLARGVIMIDKTSRSALERESLSQLG